MIKTDEVSEQGCWGGPPELIRRFKADGPVVLLGTSTFWEGVDVQGEALSRVLIDKLPGRSSA
jgi:Rad3-related DNA helicase